MKLKSALLFIGGMVAGMAIGCAGTYYIGKKYVSKLVDDATEEELKKLLPEFKQQAQDYYNKKYDAASQKQFDDWRDKIEDLEKRELEVERKQDELARKETELNYYIQKVPQYPPRIDEGEGELNEEGEELNERGETREEELYREGWEMTVNGGYTDDELDEHDRLVEEQGTIKLIECTVDDFVEEKWPQYEYREITVLGDGSFYDFKNHVSITDDEYDVLDLIYTMPAEKPGTEKYYVSHADELCISLDYVTLTYDDLLEQHML